MSKPFDVAIIGAGAAGLIGVDFALRLGARVAVIEKERIGGDCTWTGCIPSKSLVRAARAAYEARQTAKFGLARCGETIAAPAGGDLGGVAGYLDGAVAQIAALSTAEKLRARGAAVFLGGARFVDARTVQAGAETVTARKFLLCTGAEPVIPTLPGLEGGPYFTYKTIFANRRLPQRLIVIGGGPVGCEIAQAYRRLGAEVTVFAARLLPKECDAARAVLAAAWRREGIAVVAARAREVRWAETGAADGAAGDGEAAGGRACTVVAEGAEATGDMLLIAAGRKPALKGLELAAAGVRAGDEGITIDAYLRTTAGGIYACGDATPSEQFSHVAGWQAFVAVRNALLPGRLHARLDAAPRVTFTDPEIAQVGVTAEEARRRWGAAAHVERRELAAMDRAVCEGDGEGFVELVAHGGRLAGATVVSRNAGEVASELAVAAWHKFRLRDLAGPMRPYPTHGSDVQRLASAMMLDELTAGMSGWWLRWSRTWRRRRQKEANA